MKLINEPVIVNALPIAGSVARRADQAAAREELRELFAGNDKPLIYTILRHVAPPGLAGI